jgi:hypothetical protein
MRKGLKKMGAERKSQRFMGHGNIMKHGNTGNKINRPHGCVKHFAARRMTTPWKTVAAPWKTSRRKRCGGVYVAGRTLVWRR